MVGREASAGGEAMTDLPRAARVARRAEWGGDAADRLRLDYDQRFLRRRRLEAEGGLSFLVDLAETTGIDDGDAFVLDDGRTVAVHAASEPLYEIRGDIPRLAWHIGNRHTPCEIGPDRLVIRRDHVLKGMLEGLGAEVVESEGPFRPEGGAYGPGRTMGHAHGSDQEPDQGQAHGHAHVAHHAYHHHLAEEDPEDPGEEA
jgi:urease accessory protein